MAVANRTVDRAAGGAAKDRRRVIPVYEAVAAFRAAAATSGFGAPVDSDDVALYYVDQSHILLVLKTGLILEAVKGGKRWMIFFSTAAEK